MEEKMKARQCIQSASSSENIRITDIIPGSVLPQTTNQSKTKVSSEQLTFCGQEETNLCPQKHC